MARSSKSENRLRNSTSPYLQQHADNPVDWWPWCPEALEAAREARRPILLSIGYSACHWCHVMAHESFEDPATAERMNSLYVNIKVDREERPDLDRIHQLAHQALTQRSGGWPLTVILDPEDLTPFFAGTYFPPEPRHGMPAFGDLLQQIRSAWDKDRDAILKQNENMRKFLADISAPRPPGQPDAEVFDRAWASLSRLYDAESGGFGSAPKFPQPGFLEFLQCLGEQLEGEQPASEARQMLRHNLAAMARGGVCDQIGGGFFRYSVDRQWMIPHFEKMGYDNARLLPLYAHAAGPEDPLPGRTARAVGDWVLRELEAPEGGYYSSLDADSEGEEGRFYVWDANELRQLLSESEWPVAAAHWGFDQEPNFEQCYWHAHVQQTVEQIAEDMASDPGEIRAFLDDARVKLFAHREQRVHPGRDDKILTAWNGLMISALARSGRLLDVPAYLESACRAVDFLRRELWRDGRLLVSWRSGQARLNGYLDDYAFLLDGLLELLQSQWREQDLAWARELAEALLAHFEDPENGGFYFTSHDHEPLIQRPRPFQDDALPAGNGVAARALLRLGQLLAEPRYVESAHRCLRAGWEELEQVPHAYCSMLLALMDWLEPPRQLVLRGDGAELEQVAASARAQAGPRDAIYVLPSAGALDERFPARGAFTAYLCEGTHCSKPLTDPEKLEW